VLASRAMFQRQRTGSVVCPSCGRLVGVNDERCLNCGRRRPGLFGFAGALRSLGGDDLGFVKLVLGASILLYGTALIMAPESIGGGGMFSFLSPDPRALFALGASGAVPVFGYGRWWTVLSAGWLHASLLHILFNMLWVRDLGPLTARFYGASRMVIIYTVAGVVGFLLSSLAGAYLSAIPVLRGAELTVGASAPIFGLLAALVYYGRRSGHSSVGSQAWGYAVVLFIFGFVMSGIDNWAHLGGFLGGYVAARVLDPLREERPDHTVVALVCLGATALAIVASVVTALQGR
jgi:rhomboid protease GluP